MASVISSEEERREKSCSAFSHVGASSLVVVTGTDDSVEMTGSTDDSVEMTGSTDDSVEMTGSRDFFLIFSTMNLNLSGLMKLSWSSCLRLSIPATASNPKGLPSTLVNLCTSRGGTAFVSHGFPVLGGLDHSTLSLPESPQGGELLN